jgi:calcineurin-like phosphoesterase family protein
VTISVGFTSDLHLGHKLAARCRGYNSTEEHDSAIIEMLKTQCTKRTLLWILGDVAMSITALDRLKEIPCRKRLVSGNHDNFQLGVYLKYFEDVRGFLRYKQMWLSHCPIHPQELYRCKLNVHGHIHKNTNSPELPLPYVNVNWDFWKRAISLDELRELV